MKDSFVGGAFCGYGGAPPTYLQGKKKTDDGREDDGADDKSARDMLDERGVILDQRSGPDPLVGRDLALTDGLEVGVADRSVIVVHDALSSMSSAQAKQVRLLLAPTSRSTGQAPV